MGHSSETQGPGLWGQKRQYPELRPAQGTSPRQVGQVVTKSQVRRAEKGRLVQLRSRGREPPSSHHPPPLTHLPGGFHCCSWGSHDRLHPLSRNDFSQLPREPLSSPGMTRVPLASGRHCCPQPGCRLLVGQAGLREPWAGSAGGGALRVQGGAGPTASPDGGPAVSPGTEERVPEGVG